jgi:PAS domain S-box-containing protein
MKQPVPFLAAAADRPTEPPAQAALRAENAALRARLAEAEDALHAMRNGEAVDPGTSVRAAKGEIIGSVSVLRDTAEHKHAEATLRESEERLRQAQQLAHLGSWELDLAANRLTWSDEVYRIFGLQPGNFGATYEAFLDLVHSEDRAKVDEAFAASLREKRCDAYEIEHRVVRADSGEVRIVHERCRHLRDAAGNIVRSLGMVQDITDYKRTEEELLRNQSALQALNNDLVRFNNVAVGRELRMIELKREINALCAAAGQSRRYRLGFAQAPQ